MLNYQTIILDPFFPLNHIPGLLLWSKNQDSIYISSNAACAKLFGFKSPNEMIGHTDNDLRCEFVELAPLFQEHDKQTIEQARTLTFLEVVQCEKDKWGIFVVNKTPILNEQREIIGTNGHALDVTNIFWKLANYLATGEYGLLQPQLFQQSYLIGSKYKNIELSRRQIECLFFLLRGKTSKSIAKLLKLSPRTIEDYIEQLKDIFNCHSKLELIEEARHHGFMNLIPHCIFDSSLSIHIYD